MIILFSFSSFGGLFFDWLLKENLDESELVYIHFSIFPFMIISSAAYLKFYVLKNNPINQLRRLHKRGRNID